VFDELNGNFCIGGRTSFLIKVWNLKNTLLSGINEMPQVVIRIRVGISKGSSVLPTGNMPSGTFSGLEHPLLGRNGQLLKRTIVNDQFLDNVGHQTTSESPFILHIFLTNESALDFSAEGSLSICQHNSSENCCPLSPAPAPKEPIHLRQC
jgi:hypothetical protein